MKSFPKDIKEISFEYCEDLSKIKNELEAYDQITKITISHEDVLSELHKDL